MTANTRPQFGAHVEIHAVVERVTGRIAMDDSWAKQQLTNDASTWIELARSERRLQLVDLWTADASLHRGIDDDRDRWPGERLDGSEEPWKPGTFSLLRRFPIWPGTPEGPSTLDGLFLSWSWRTEGQRFPGSKGGWTRYDEWDYEPATFAEWRRVHVYYIAVATQSPSKPAIVMALPPDVSTERNSR